MREIKFRCWIDYGPGHCTMLYDRGNLSEFFDAADGSPLMQYTGLKDKSGKEIYEGDILLHHHRVKDWIQPPIEWRDNLEDCGIGVCGYKIDQACANDAEVIGNIYENPELLPVKTGE